MHVPIEDVDRLILNIHASALDENRWPELISELCCTMEASGTMLFSVPTARCGEFWNVLSGIDPNMPREYAREFAPEDPWALAAKHLPAPMAGRVVTGEELIDRREFIRTRFFNEFTANYDIHHFMCLLTREPPFRGAIPGGALSFYRGESDSAFTADECTILSRLAPHLVLAIDTLSRVRALSLRNAVMTETLDSVASAIFILDYSGRVLFENRAAQAARAEGGCVRIVSGRLEPSENVREQRSCRGAMHELLCGRAATVELTVGLQKQRIFFSTAPFPKLADPLSPWEGASGIVWLTPSTAGLDVITRIAELFKLTAAEAHLLTRVSAGTSLRDAAGAQNISVHTARNQLKAIQRKTGWRTQTELVRMVQQLSAISPPAVSR